jgi:hypothetical protein
LRPCARTAAEQSAQADFVPFQPRFQPPGAEVCGRAEAREPSPPAPRQLKLQPASGSPPPHHAYCVVTGPIFTTWKSVPFRLRRVARSSSFQRGSGAPLTYQALPLSASSIPYFFIAATIG